MQRSQVEIIKQEREVLKRSNSRERCLIFHISENGEQRWISERKGIEQGKEISISSRQKR